MKHLRLLPVIVVLYTPHVLADFYFGANGGLGYYNSDITDKYNISSSGTTYGGVLGLRVQFLGIETLYQKFSTEGKIKHSGTEYKLVSDTTAIGAAIRFNLNILYFRAGYAHYKIEQGIRDTQGQTQNSAAMNSIYKVKPQGDSVNGFVAGGGLQYRLSKNFKVFADYTRYNMPDIDAHYSTITGGIVINFQGPKIQLKND